MVVPSGVILLQFSDKPFNCSGKAARVPLCAAGFVIPGLLLSWTTELLKAQALSSVGLGKTEGLFIVFNPAVGIWRQ